MFHSSLRSLVLLAVCFYCEFCSAQSEESLPIVGSVIAKMKYGDRLNNIYPMSSNVKLPAEQWQFRYLPLLVPEVDGVGGLNISVQTIDNSSVVSLAIWLDNDRARASAFDALKDVYPSESSRLTATNVSVAQISNVHFTVKHPYGTWNSDPINPGSSPSIILTIP
ncbi:MAG: hypothetical protein KDA65_19205, partial [Planctomycetaceae bacterium]|nr:hypothetical protein [Planctomycetaceae bacterium]